MKKYILMVMLAASNLIADSPVTYWQEENLSIPTNWQSFLNPNSLNFWKEGDYTPPLPQIWAMKNPTKNNIALYQEYLQRRATIMENFHKALKQDKIDQVETITVAFRSDCSACHQLLTELASHPEVYERIQLLQVDKPNVPVPWPLTRLSEQQTKALNISAVPTIWVKTKGKETQRLPNPTKLFEEYL